MNNTAGPIHDAAPLNLNTFGRIVVVGPVALADRFDQPDIGPRFLRRILVTRDRIEEFLLDDFEPHDAETRSQLTKLYQEGLLDAREDVAEGIKAAPIFPSRENPSGAQLAFRDCVSVYDFSGFTTPQAGLAAH